MTLLKTFLLLGNKVEIRNREFMLLGSSMLDVQQQQSNLHRNEEGKSLNVTKMVWTSFITAIPLQKAAEADFIKALT